MLLIAYITRLKWLASLLYFISLLLLDIIFLSSRCPYRDDRYLSELVPVGPSSGLQYPSHFRRFIFKMFTFVNPYSLVPLSEQVIVKSSVYCCNYLFLYCSANAIFLVQVFIHCSTAVCTSGAGQSCEPSCYRKSKRWMYNLQNSCEICIVFWHCFYVCL